MTTLALDHLNIKTADVAGTLAFYRDVLQMEVRPGPGSTSTDNGGWIYDPSGAPVIHVNHIAMPFPADDVLGDPSLSRGPGSGTVDHVAFRCVDYDQVIDRLDSFGLIYVENHIASIDLRQVFLRDPNGIVLELNFRAA
jgi:catechol 2,3-dioxygenase-like lactoylglutathione lyase family enzyme